MEQAQKKYIYDVINTLPQREQGIVKLYMAGFTEVEIAESYQVSQQMIHKIKKRALGKCKVQLEQQEELELELECVSTA